MKMVLSSSTVGPITVMHLERKQNSLLFNFTSLKASASLDIAGEVFSSLNLSIARESITSVIFSFPKTYVVFLNICLPQELSFRT